MKQYRIKLTKDDGDVFYIGSGFTSWEKAWDYLLEWSKDKRSGRVFNHAQIEEVLNND